MNIFQKIFNFNRAAKLPEPYESGGTFYLPTSDIDINPIRDDAQAYQSNTGYVYVAVNRLAHDVSVHPYQIRTPTDSNNTDDWQIATGGQVAQLKALLKRPNANTTWRQFLYVTDVSWSLTGQFFWHIITQNGKPVGLEFIPTHWITRPEFVQKDKVQVHTGWQVAVPGYAETFISKDDMVRAYIPDPADPFDAISPLEAVASAHYLGQYMRGYGLSIFKNGGGVPAGILSTDQLLNEDQIKDISERWEQKYKYTRDKIAVLNKGTKYQTIALPFENLDFEKINASVEDLVLAAYAVPRAVLGLSRDYNKANMNGALIAYLNYGLKPRLSIYEDSLNTHVIPRFFGKADLLLPSSDYALVFDKPELEDREAHRAEWKEKLQLGTCTVNEYRVAMGERKTPDGDVYLVPANVAVTPDYDEYLKGMEEAKAQAAKEAQQKPAPAEKALEDTLTELVAVQIKGNELPESVNNSLHNVDLEPIYKSLEALAEDNRLLKRTMAVEKKYKQLRAYFAGMHTKEKNNHCVDWKKDADLRLEMGLIEDMPELKSVEGETRDEYYERLKGKDGKVLAERIIDAQIV